MKKILIILGTIFIVFISYYFFQLYTWKIEKKEILEQAQTFVQGNSVNDLKFELHFKKKIGNWVYLQAIATNQQLDPLGIVFEKVNGKWKIYDMGTTFPDLEQRIPQLFTD